MCAADRRRPPDIPPPPPSRRARLGAWLRRMDRAGHGWTLVVAAALVGGLTVLVVATVGGLWLQPRFTVLELAAQRLAPQGVAAQPPVEEVTAYAAFDRHYVVEFPTPAAGLPAVVDLARAQQWQIREGPDGGTVAFERGGVRADVTVTGRTTRVETSVATWVRRRQQQARWAALAIGALVAAVWVRRQNRRQPRLVG